MSLVLQTILYITYLGTASFLIDGSDARILTDPGDFFTNRLTIEKAKSILNVDIVLVTHADFDHTNRLPDIQNVKNLPVVGTQSIKAGFPLLKVITGDTYTRNGLEISRLKSIHGVRHDVDHSSYLIKTGSITILFLGDAYRLIDPVENHVDIMFVTIGGFEASPENAVKLVSEIKPDAAIPMHWETLARTDEPALRFQKLLRISSPSVQCIIPRYDRKIRVEKGSRLVFIEE